MKKWLFSNQGKIVGPKTESEAVKYVKDNPNVYVWQPKFGLWQPAAMLEEFSGDDKVPCPPATLSASDVESFHSKETQLLATLERIDKTLRVSASSIKEVNEDIETYHGMTKSLIKEVQQTIKTIENQHKALQKNLAGVTNSDIALMVGED